MQGSPLLFANCGDPACLAASTTRVVVFDRGDTASKARRHARNTEIPSAARETNGWMRVHAPSKRLQAVRGRPSVPKAALAGSPFTAKMWLCTDKRPVRRSPYGFLSRYTEIDARKKKKFRAFKKKRRKCEKSLEKQWGRCYNLSKEKTKKEKRGYIYGTSRKNHCFSR